MRILVVEDNQKLAQYSKQLFEEEGYAVDVAFDGKTGERMAGSLVYDLIVLDVMLPEKDGIAVCTDLRTAGVVTPIILLTALGETEDKVLGLDSGADDYMVKPFEMKELLARTRSLLRRPQSTITGMLTVQDIELDSLRHVVLQNKKIVSLTLKEYVILEYLMRNVDTVVSREQLLEHCWDFAYSAFSNITDVYIRQLRKKLHDTDEKYIQTIRGVGYKFKSQ
ncbi:MAG: hypothetical protein RLZZ76_704 [Candidatus Parcubacteria bacterium]|jgi:DNA-binding response OmpR family regulator